MTRLLLVAAFCLTSQCDSKYVRPASGPGTDYPCGLQAHVCLDHKTCCDNGYDCGGDVPNCPPDACCSNLGLRSVDGGRPKMLPKRSL